MPVRRLHNLGYLFYINGKGFNYAVGQAYRIRENFSDRVGLRLL